MSNPRSSFHADPTSRRSPWPWLLAAGPALVVVASLCSAWLAISKSDPVVAENYYKLGLTINRTLAVTPAPHVPTSATIVIGAGGDVSLQLRDMPAAPRFVRLTLRAPGARDGDIEMLAAMSGDRWTGKLHNIPAGRMIVTVESDAWQLPVTVVDRLPATVRLDTSANS